MAIKFEALVSRVFILLPTTPINIDSEKDNIMYNTCSV